eukprot:SAG31_NODE_47813_length_216_cov_19.931624_1_plen_72_part_11
MSWAPTSTQPADTAHHRASKPQSINAINAERQRDHRQIETTTKAMARRRVGGRAGGRAQQSWCPGFESRTTH